MFGKPVAEIRPTDEKEVQGVIEKGKTEMAPLVRMLRGKPGKTGPFSRTSSRSLVMRTFW